VSPAAAVDRVVLVSRRRVRELAGAAVCDGPDKLIKMALGDVERLVREFNPD
jgi:hypothetical protein